MTKSEKLAWAEKLRAPSNLPFSAPEGYLSCLEKVDKKTLQIPTAVGDSRCYLITPKGAAKSDILYINIHGGGFVQPHNLWDGALCATMALEFDCPVLDIDYRTAPEVSFPSPILECYDVVQWTFAHAAELGIDPAKVVLGGNSAGATLTASVCMMAKEKGGRIPALAVLLYPAIPPLITEGIRIEEIGEADLTDLRVRGMLYNELYYDEIPAGMESYVHLRKAGEEQLSAFPETVIVTAGLDPLRFDGEQFASMIAVSASKITLQRFPNSDHGFFTRCLGDEWQAARALVFGIVRDKFALTANPQHTSHTGK